MTRCHLPTLLLATALVSAAAAAPARADGDLPAGDLSAEQRDPATLRQRIEQRQAELKARLAIQPEQEAAWSAWVQAMRPPAQRPPHPSRDQLAQLPTPQRLDFLQTLQAERAAALARRADATRALYAQLTPRQRSIFDAETARRLRDGPRHRPHHG